MGRNKKTIMVTIIGIFLLMLINDSLFMGPITFSQKASAVPREFEETITVPSNQIVPLDLLFTQGEELELIFDMVVQEDLPVDIWFVDYANYVRLVDGNEFLYFIDGSGQELKKAAKVVTVTLHGTYELVFANYNNVTIEVNLKYDINVYPEEEGEETPLWQEFYIMLPLGLIIGIVVGFFIVGKVRKPKKGMAKPEKGKPSKKPKKKKVKKKAPKEAKSAETDEEPQASEKPPSPTFCGHCGKPVETPFCPFCGKDVSKG